MLHIPKRTLKFFIYVAVVVSPSIGPTNVTAQPEKISSAQELIEKIRLSRIARPPSFSLTVREERVLKYTGASSNRLRDEHEIITSDFRVDGPRLEILRAFDTSFGGEYLHRCVFPSREDRQFIYYVPGRSDWGQVTLWTGDRADTERNRHLLHIPLDPIPIDNKPFYELFASYPDNVVLSSETEMVGDSLCYVLKGDFPPGGSRTDQCRCRVWIDPEHGYHAVKAIIEEISAAPPENMDTAKLQQIEWEWRLEATKFVKVGDYYFISEAQSGSTTKYNNGGVAESTSKHIVDNVVLNPDFLAMGAFSLDFIPEGTRVYKDEEPALVRFEWRNGKAEAVLPKVADDLAGEIDLIADDRNPQTSDPVKTGSEEATTTNTETLRSGDRASYKLLVYIVAVLVFGILFFILIHRRKR